MSRRRLHVDLSLAANEQSALHTRLGTRSPPLMRSPRLPMPSSLFLRGVALIALAVQLLGLGHLAFERHGVCWEHGEVTELRGAELAPPSAATVGHEPGFRAGASRVWLESLDGHHHCSVQATRRDWVPSAAPTLALALGPESGVVAVAEAAPRADGVLLLRAPKQSPPSAA